MLFGRWEYYLPNYVETLICYEDGRAVYIWGSQTGQSSSVLEKLLKLRQHPFFLPSPPVPPAHMTELGACHPLRSRFCSIWVSPIFLVCISAFRYLTPPTKVVVVAEAPGSFSKLHRSLGGILSTYFWRYMSKHTSNFPLWNMLAIWTCVCCLHASSGQMTMRCLISNPPFVLLWNYSPSLMNSWRHTHRWIGVFPPVMGTEWTFVA